MSLSYKDKSNIKSKLHSYHARLMLIATQISHNDYGSFGSDYDSDHYSLKSYCTSNSLYDLLSADHELEQRMSVIDDKINQLLNQISSNLQSQYYTTISIQSKQNYYDAISSLLDELMGLFTSWS